MQMKKKSIYGIIVFYTIAVGVRYLTNETELISGITNVFLKIIIQAIGPAVGALVALKIFNLKFSMSLKGFYPKTMIPLILFWILPVLIIAANAFFTKGNFAYLTVIAILTYGLLEEIGWRGFLHNN